MSKLGKKALNLGETVDGMVGDMYATGILYSEAVREFKKRFIWKALQSHRGNCVHAARELGMHRNTLSRIIAELKIDLREFRRGWPRPVSGVQPTAAAVHAHELYERLPMNAIVGARQG